MAGTVGNKWSILLNNRFIWLGGLLLMLAIIVYCWSPDFGVDIVASLSRISITWALIALLVTSLHFLAEVGRWFVYLGSTRRYRGGRLFAELFGVFSVTAFLTYMLPAKLGIPIRLYLLSSRMEVKIATASGFLALDGLLSYGSWIGLALVISTFFLGKSLFTDFRLFGVLAAGVAIVAIVFGSKATAAAQKVHEYASRIGPAGYVGVLAIILADIAGYAVRHGTILAALDTHIPATQIAFATIVSIAAGFVSLLPMGIGAYDVTIVALLVSFGAPAEIAVLVPVINRAATILVSIGLGLPASAIMGVSLLDLQQRKGVPPASGTVTIRGPD